MVNIQPSSEVRIDLVQLLPQELRDLAVEMGQAPYRGDQVFSWIHERRTVHFAAMTNLPAPFRSALEARAQITNLALVAKRESSVDGAAKFLFEIPDKGFVESVLITERDRRTACLSSQVGCALDCRFCATGRMGFRANLTAAQIIDQLSQLNQHAATHGERVTNVVMMGMGEPLLNYNNLVRVLRLMKIRGKAGVGGRRITVSTAGFVPGIRKLAAEEDLNVGLAISLNATTDLVRGRIMPINRRFGIAELLQAANEFCHKRGRRVTLEYVLLAGVNDSDEDACRLAKFAGNTRCKINLIPYNELNNELSQLGEGVETVRFSRPEARRITQFTSMLRALTSVTVTVRESKGRDIDAACGQLFHDRQSTLP